MTWCTRGGPVLSVVFLSRWSFGNKADQNAGGAGELRYPLASKWHPFLLVRCTLAWWSFLTGHLDPESNDVTLTPPPVQGKRPLELSCGW